MEETSIICKRSVSEIEEIHDSIHERFKLFKNFAVAYTPPCDHYFITTDPPPVLPPYKWRFKANDKDVQLRLRIKQEWDTLKENLPNTILVRAYEGRRDLMRVLILGLEDTPFDNNGPYGLFFFDLLLPLDYPSKPPLIHHDLLDGVGLERFRWDPQTSNIYRLLMFIRGSVFRFSKIYAKDKNKGFLLSHIAMLDNLNSPPKGFEDYVKGYFRINSHKILLRFKLRANLEEIEENSLFFELVEAFEANGSYCKHIVYEVKRQMSSNYRQQQTFSLINDDYGVSLKVDPLSMINGFIKWLCNHNNGWRIIPRNNVKFLLH